MTAKLPATDIDNAINDYLAGVNPEVILERHKIGRTTLYRHLAKRGIDRNFRRIPLPVDDIAARYLAGESENSLATAFATSRNVIRSRLEIAGVTIRGNSEANRLMMDQRTPEQNQAYTAASHAAVTGTKRTIEDLSRRAIGKERTTAHATAGERLFASWLNERGAQSVLQKAIGPYNCDIAAYPVAVEIFGGNWHAYGRHIARFAKRCNYILNSGWTMLIIWCNKDGGPITISAAEYTIAFLEETRRDPSLIGKYRMIWGNGQVIPLESDNVVNRAIVNALAGPDDLRG